MAARLFTSALVVLAAASTALWSSPPAFADLEDNVFSTLEWRIEMEAPTNWQPTEQTSYPNVLLWMERRDPRGVMLLAAERVSGKDFDSLAYAKKTVEKLEQIGFTTRSPQLHTTTGATLVDFENDTAFLRQAYLVIDGTGFTLTLSADSSRSRGLHLRAFDSALRSIKPFREPETKTETGDNDDRRQP